METRTITSSIATIIIVGLLAYFTWGVAMRLRPATAPLPSSNQGTVCPQDAMVCPDGTSVGRTGPACTFTCPSSARTPYSVSMTAALDHKITIQGEGITPLEVVEDSRCPESVQCIQAGTVRLRVAIESAAGTSEKVMKLGDTITTEAHTVTFASALPAKKTPGTIKPTAYSFTFTIASR